MDVTIYNEEVQYNALLREYSGYVLNDDQLGFVRAISKFLNDDTKRVFILQGCAGSGKTFLMNGVARYICNSKRTVKLLAPTGKAAKVLSTKSQYEAFTIHRHIYKFKELEEIEEKKRQIKDDFLEAQVVGEPDLVVHFRLLFNEDDVDAVYIIDESSLIGSVEVDNETVQFGSGKLLNDLLEFINLNYKENNRKIIFVGDSYQLPPVGMNYSPALDVDSIYAECPYLKNRDAIQTYALETVVRQKADSGVLKVATYLRDKLQVNRFNELKLEEHPKDVKKIQHKDFISTYMKHICEEGLDKVMVIAYSNASVDIYNRLIREQLFPHQQELTKEDRLLLTRNVKVGDEYLINGDFVKVAEVGQQIVRDVTMETEIIRLYFRKAMIEVNEERHNVLIMENLLTSNERSLSKLELKALFRDFKIRNSAAIQEAKKGSKSEYKQKLQELFLTDQYINALQVKYGYAITCHKAQGSEWDTVFLDCNLNRGYRNRETFQWFYTGITRSSGKLYLVDLPSGLTMDGNIKTYIQPHMQSIQRKEPLLESEATGIVSSSAETTTVEFNHTKCSQQLEVPQELIPSRLTCDGNSMSTQAQQIVKHILGVLGDIPCMVTAVIDHTYQVIVTLKVHDWESRISVYYNGKGKVSRVNYIDSISDRTVVDRLATLIGKFTIEQVAPVTIHGMVTIENVDGATIESQESGLEDISVVDTFVYPPEYEYFLKDYMQGLEEKLKPHHIQIMEIQSLQFCLRVTFTRYHQITVLNIFYKSKGLISTVSPHIPGCKDLAFRDEVIRCIVR